MPSGDEPQLGGLPEDNAPMISGRGTKIIVSARGAYQAGNLDALVGHMSDEQQLCFKQALTRNALAVMDSIIPPEQRRALPPLLDRVSLEECVAAVHRWLDAPSPAAIEAVTEISESLIPIIDYLTQQYQRTGLFRRGELPKKKWDELWTLAWTASYLTGVVCAPFMRDPPAAMDSCQAFEMVVRMAALERVRHLRKQTRIDTMQRVIALVHRWQVDASWAILQRQQPPTFEIMQP